VGTEKRERKKANRQLRLEQERKAELKRKTQRKAIKIAVIVAVIIAFLVVVALVFRSSDDEAAPATTVATTVAPTTTSPEVTTPGSTPPPGDEGGQITGETPCPATDHQGAKVSSFELPPPDCLEPGATYTAEVTTSQGSFTVELYPDKAPITVNNFVVLARYGYFDNTICHRAIPQFVVQCGDPTATGTGGPGYRFADELPEAGEYEVGSLAMANSGPDTNGSQFFVITGDNGAALPPNYSLFGKVIDGLDTTVAAMDALGNPASNGVPPLGEIRIESVRISQS
jgi:cyclophilin family peptidyl-prolyl cis-trans isomerase